MDGQTEGRMREIRRRVRARRRRWEAREIFLLAVASVLLLVGMGAVLGETGPGAVASANAGYGSLLLRQDASSYVVVAVFAFVAGVTLAIVCVRLRTRRGRDASRNAGGPSSLDA